MLHLEVDRAALDQVRVLEEPDPQAADGEAVVRVDAFALTANNITYAVFGDAMQYWSFFPAEGSWGRIPVWGFGSVVESRSPDLAVGERLYGYFPMGSHLVMRPGGGDALAVFDTSPHRAPMAATYNRYVRCAADPGYRADREPHQMLLYPLFYTSFLVDDFLSDQQDFGAEQVILSSASSKTAIGIAHQVHARGKHVVGLTSEGNRAFVEGLGVVDEVVTYDAVDSVAQVPSAFVDVAGNADVRLAVHRRLADQLGHSMVLGGTHWDHQSDAAAEPLPGPTPEFFFAPTQITKRSEDWGAEVLAGRVSEAWAVFREWADGWLDLHRAQGADEVQAAYLELLGGGMDPSRGQVCSLAPVTP